ncbi:MAG: type IV-A pilus assembly ATPase PilB [Gammaproteobacteria bacterium]|nr:type IV-A pilus assembly ATPase PilB [Gammaproteobacteria bacterium]
MATVVSGNTILEGLAKRLVEENILSAEAANQAMIQATKAGHSLINYLITNRVVDSRNIAHATSREYGLPLLDISQYELDNSLIDSLGEKLIREHNLLPLSQRGNMLFVAVSDPGQFKYFNELKFHTGLTIEGIIVEADKLAAAIEKTLASADSALMELTDGALEELEIAAPEKEPVTDNQEGDINDTPVVRFINKILVDAIRRGASDIHFEPYEKKYRVRFRLDGMLQEMAAPPVELGNRISSRIKVMAQLDISEKRIPQDGRIKINLSKNRAVDFRVSTCPTLFGEKIVMRILDSMSTELSIDALGFEDKQRQIVESFIDKPYGMILVTGPTGSGKTVTLYTALSILNSADRNISTAEDPAEIYMSGVNQVNINTKTGLTFANALRSFLRQDPDVIMVGEIRDLETAEIAIKASQTGHLVLSTLHTNDAPQTLTRLINMGVPSYNIASSISLIIAQRLVRKLCDHCKRPESLPQEALLKAGFREDDIEDLTTYHPVGCDKCNGGYKGRVGIFQVLPVSEKMGWIIMEGGNSMQLEQQAQAEGITDLRQAGLDKVKAGVTSLEEINRVTRE